MAKNVNDTEESGEGSARRSNGFDQAVVQGFIDRVENLYGELASEKGEFMERCKRIHDDVKEVLKEAKRAGIPKKSLKGVVRKRKLEGDIEAIREDLEGDDQDGYDAILQAIGALEGTPLGNAALATAH